VCTQDTSGLGMGSVDSPQFPIGGSVATKENPNPPSVAQLKEKNSNANVRQVLRSFSSFLSSPVHPHLVTRSRKLPRYPKVQDRSCSLSVSIASTPKFHPRRRNSLQEIYSSVKVRYSGKLIKCVQCMFQLFLSLRSPSSSFRITILATPWLASIKRVLVR